ncbi:MAG TPA: hypothetical protein VIS07_08465 [Candidatus Binatia bacterium]
MDRPVSGRSVKISKSGPKTRLVFVTTDPAFLFPEPESADDPTSGTPGGITVDVFARGAAPASVGAPPGIGTPGWRLVRAKIRTYRYRGRGGALASVLLREGKRLQVAASDLGMDVTAPLGAVAVRVTLGSLRSCAVFTETSVQRDRAGLFAARNAPAPQLADCADDTLLLALGDPCASESFPFCGAPCPDGGTCAPDVVGSVCRCVYPTQPCGDTAPLCGGTCPAGQSCWPIDGGFPGPTNACLCAPSDTPPCGTSGMACDGACPDGLECQLIPGNAIFESACGCTDPAAVCGAPGFGACPHPDLQCVVIPGSGYQCLPIPCGSAPECGGTCSGGRECVPVGVPGSDLCICVTPGG